MDLIEKLNHVSSNKNTLTSFLKENIQTVYDFFLSQSYHELKEYEEKIDNYIFSNYKIVKKIDLGINENFTFVTILLDICERFGFLAYFKRLYKLLDSSNSNISQKLQATALFSIGIKKFSDYESVFDIILNKLQNAFQSEEDSVDRVLSTFINYYAQVVYNYGQFNNKGVILFKNRIEESKSTYFFLTNTLIDEILLIDITNFRSAYTEIHLKLDLYLKRTKVEFDFSVDKYLIESSTEYCNILANVRADFNSIRNISVNEYGSIQDDSIFHSLGRGVEILKEESQLFAYMKSYGNMHYAKLIEAFNLLPKPFFNSEVEIFDWGCGQAMASLSYLDYLKKNNYSQIINLVTLNEPSEIAIKRGALHLTKFDEQIGIYTINKDLDSLNIEDFNVNKSIKLHMFSNILDIDLFSMNKLTSLIKSTFKGINYFIIVSPYITEIKKNRIDSFINEFSSNDNFEHIQSINKQKRRMEE